MLFRMRSFRTITNFTVALILWLSLCNIFSSNHVAMYLWYPASRLSGTSCLPNIFCRCFSMPKVSTFLLYSFNTHFQLLWICIYWIIQSCVFANQQMFTKFPLFQGFLRLLWLLNCHLLFASQQITDNSLSWLPWLLKSFCSK